MQSMRDIILIAEGRKPKAATPTYPVVDSSALYGEITALESILQGMGFRFDSDWVTQAMEVVKQRKLTHERSEAEEAERYGDEHQPTAFDAKDIFRDTIADVVKRGTVEHEIYAEANVSERMYQGEFVDPDNPDNYVEASAFLTALYAQKDLAAAFRSFDPNKPSTWMATVHGTQRVVKAFHDFVGSQERFEPAWLDAVMVELGHLLPTMRFLLKNRIVG